MRTSTATAVLEIRDGGVLLLLDGTESSWIDLHDPTHLDFEYLQQMDAALTALHGAHAPIRAVHLGGAGCALARAWDSMRPESSQLVVEIDAVLARSVRQWFGLPRAPRLRIRQGDAATVTPQLRPGSWDVIVRDVFSAGEVPPSCRTPEFTRACSRALRRDGLYLVNAASAPRCAAAEEIAVVRNAFAGALVVADQAVARGRRRGNLVIIARAEPFSTAEVEAVERAMRRLPLPVRTWAPTDPALPRSPDPASR